MFFVTSESCRSEDENTAAEWKTTAGHKNKITAGRQQEEEAPATFHWCSTHSRRDGLLQKPPQWQAPLGRNPGLHISNSSQPQGPRRKATTSAGISKTERDSVSQSCRHLGKDQAAVRLSHSIHSFIFFTRSLLSSGSRRIYNFKTCLLLCLQRVGTNQNSHRLSEPLLKRDFSSDWIPVHLFGDSGRASRGELQFDKSGMCIWN